MGNVAHMTIPLSGRASAPPSVLAPFAIAVQATRDHVFSDPRR